MTNTSKSYFSLKSKKEEAIMQVMWTAQQPLSAAEIAERIPKRDWPASSIQSILRNLEKKDAIKVAEIAKIGKVYGRLFEPTLSANEYATMQFSHYYQQDDKDCFSISSSILGNASYNKESIVEALYSLLEKYEEE